MNGAEYAGTIIQLHNELVARDAEIARLTALLEEAKAVIKPFAARTLSEDYIASRVYDEGLCAAMSYTTGDYRRARALLAKLNQTETK